MNCELGGKSTSYSPGMAEKWRMSLAVMESMTKIDPWSLRPGSMLTKSSVAICFFVEDENACRMSLLLCLELCVEQSDERFIDP